MGPAGDKFLRSRDVGYGGRVRKERSDWSPPDTLWDKQTLLLFSDAMIAEDVVEDGVGGDGVAGYGRDGGDGFAKVLGN